MNPTPSSTYTSSVPKRGDITGASDQAFGKGFDFVKQVLGGIAAGHIAAIGTISKGTSTLQYIYALQIHSNLAGTPISLVGNASNKMGKFSCVYLTLSNFCMIQNVSKKEELDQLVLTGDEFENNILDGTSWKDKDIPISGTLIPNAFIIYFGQTPPSGDIVEDDVK